MGRIITGKEKCRVRHDTAVFSCREISNGIKVWIQDPPILTTDEGILIVVLSGIGSQVDPKGQYGLAHFFEHIPFRGTRKFPQDGLIHEVVKNRGGSITANTGLSRTIYQVNLPEDELDLAIQVLSQITKEPLLRKRDIRIEKGAIRAEFSRIFREGEGAVHSFTLKALFGEDHPWGHIPLGRLAQVERINDQKLSFFHKKFYTATNIQIRVIYKTCHQFSALFI